MGELSGEPITQFGVLRDARSCPASYREKGRLNFSHVWLT
jgi:hypothetical protein